MHNLPPGRLPFGRTIKPKKWYSRFMPSIPSNVVAAFLVIGGFLTVLGLIFGGYIANIYKLFHMVSADGHMGEFVCRIIGIFLFPLGIVMGWFF